jgi:polar amino acid transport system permease protein/polar amino acid transport system substrate-binding protein
MRLSRTKNGKKTVFSVFAGIYIDVIRGTPAVLQLLILYFAVLPATASKELAAVIAFSINSGAYVAEIVRAGIQAVDYGQTEAGRSLGLSQRATMQYIIIPQAMKNILPALVNEFIVLLKETAVAGYIGVMDLTKVSDFIVSRTFIAFMPLIGTAVIYFTIVKILSVLLGKLERRLRQSDSR